MNGKDVLVTGSSGFLGGHFFWALSEAGAEVRGVDLRPSETTHIVGDVRDFVAPDMGWDYIFHFAAPVGGRQKIEGDPLFNAESLEIDSHVFRMAARMDPRPIVIYPSSSAVYGRVLQHEDARSLHEGMFHPQHPNWFAPDEMYGFTKLVGEFLAWTAARYGVNTLALRPFSGYGEGQSFDYPIPSIARRALLRQDPLTIWGSGDQSRDFIHVDDLVRLTLKRLEKSVHGFDTMNLGSGHAVTFRQIARLLAEIVGYSPDISTDESKPEGVKRRWADIGRQQFYQDRPLVSLREGLTRVLADVEQRMKVPV